MSSIHRTTERSKRVSMFNQTCTKVDSSNALSINAVNGVMLKNYKGSFFVRCHLKSPAGENLLSANCLALIGRIYRSAVVIQVMICGDMEVIAEVMRKEDFEKLWSGGESI